MFIDPTKKSSSKSWPFNILLHRYPHHLVSLGTYQCFKFKASVRNSLMPIAFFFYASSRSYLEISKEDPLGFQINFDLTSVYLLLSKITGQKKPKKMLKWSLTKQYEHLTQTSRYFSRFIRPELTVEWMWNSKKKKQILGYKEDRYT